MKKTKLKNIPDNKTVWFNKSGLPKWTLIKKEKGFALLNAILSGISRKFKLSKEVFFEG